MPKNFEIKTTFRAVDKTSRVLTGMQAKVAKFTAKASMAMRRLNRITSKLSSGLTRTLKVGAIAGAAGIGLVFAAVNRTAEAMDALAKKTRAMDFPIEEFQEWRFAAEQSGVASEVFDKSLMKFTKTVGELKGGYGAMFTALKKTNPELLKQLQNATDVDKAFEVYLKAIGNTPGAMDKAALATAGFGRAGADMINLANAGAKEIGKLRKEMRANGVVTAKQAAEAEAYNDMMNSLSKTVTGLMVDVLTPLMPIMKDVAKSTRAWFIENKGLISQGLKEKLSWLVKNFENIVYWLKQIGKGIVIFYAVTTAVKVLNASMAILNTLMNINLGPMKKAGAYMGTTMPSQVGKASKAVKGFQGVLGALTAFVIGWEIGTILHDKLVEPFMKARHEAELLAGDLEVSMGVDLSKRGVKQLENYQKEAEAFIKQKQGSAGEFMRRTHGMGKSEDLLKAEEFLKKVKAQLVTARAKAADNEELLSLGGGRGGVPVEEGGKLPTGTVIKSEHKEVVDININDKTTGSKVEVKGKRSGGGLNLVHTGATP